MPKILLVEDDNSLREIYEARLQAEGYTIVAAHDGEEALVIAKSENPDLIISDVMMPKISGFEMLDILRNTDSFKGIKIIMLTALGQNEDQQRADRLGADRYLVKSQVTLEDIVKASRELLDPNYIPSMQNTNSANTNQAASPTYQNSTPTTVLSSNNSTPSFSTPTSSTIDNATPLISSPTSQTLSPPSPITTDTLNSVVSIENRPTTPTMQQAPIATPPMSTQVQGAAVHNVNNNSDVMPAASALDSSAVPQPLPSSNLTANPSLSTVSSNKVSNQEEQFSSTAQQEGGLQPVTNNNNQTSVSTNASDQTSSTTINSTASTIAEEEKDVESQIEAFIADNSKETIGNDQNQDATASSKEDPDISVKANELPRLSEPTTPPFVPPALATDNKVNDIPPTITSAPELPTSFNQSEVASTVNQTLPLEPPNKQSVDNSLDLTPEPAVAEVTNPSNQLLNKVCEPASNETVNHNILTSPATELNPTSAPIEPQLTAVEPPVNSNQTFEQSFSTPNTASSESSNQPPETIAESNQIGLGNRPAKKIISPLPTPPRPDLNELLAKESTSVASHSDEIMSSIEENQQKATGEIPEVSPITDPNNIAL